MLRVSLLGEQAITDEGTGVRVRSSRAAALIAFLATHAGSPQPRQRIAGLFWPDSTDAQALTNLRRELHQLRRVLGGEPSLVVTARDLCWRDTGTCRVDLRVFGLEREAALAAADDDAEALAHATRALAEYGGDLLPGVYDEWLLEVRAELERQCVDMCDMVSELRARRGDLAGAADVARRRIQLQPLEEVGYRTLMRLQAEMGDRAGAVSTYHHCASVLERELGITPDHQTQREFRRLIASDLMAADGPRPAAREPETRRPGPAAAPLVGRARELGLLREAWRDAAAGRSALVLVRGGAGVGKTRLVTEVADLARRQGAVVAATQCFGSEGRLALAPVADWLRHPAVQPGLATLADTWRAEVGRLVPAHAERAAEAGAMADAWQRHRFFEGLARALLAAGRPTLLVLDNAQWCDQETLTFITFCLRLSPGARLLVAGTVRDDPGDDPAVRAWTDTMRSAGLLTEIPLGPFEPADTASLAEAIAGRPLPAAEATLLQAATGGFPLYVVEAMRGAIGPAGRTAGHLTSVLRDRLEQASAAARDVAGLAAAVGTDFTLDLLTEASDLEADLVVTAVDELWRRRIMREFGAGYDFAHDLLREAAYAQVSRPKRWLLHRRVAQGLELLYADDLDPVAAQLAAQYARGGRPARAVPYYRRAANVAAGVFAYDEAIRLYREALAIIAVLPAGRERDRQELTVLEAMTAPLNARSGYSSPHLERTAERTVTLARSLGRTDSTLLGMFALWTSWFVQGRTADCYQVASQALALAEAGSGSGLNGAAHFAVGGSAVSLGKPREGLRHLERAGQLFLSVGTRSDIHATAWSAHACWLLGRNDDALASSNHAIAMARAIDHPYNLTMALAYAAITHQLRQDGVALAESVGELRVLCDRYGFAYYREWALILDGWSRPGGAGIELAQRGIGHLKAESAFARMPYWLALLADLLARNDQPDAARATLDAAIAAAHAHQDLWWLPEVTRMRAAYDEDAAAIARLRSAAQMASEHGSDALIRRCERDLAARSVLRPT